MGWDRGEEGATGLAVSGVGVAGVGLRGYGVAGVEAYGGSRVRGRGSGAGLFFILFLF